MAWLLPPLPPTFEAALRDVRAHKPEARVAAAERLADPETSREHEAVQGLLALADDLDPRVRATAMRALHELGDERALPCLVRKVDDADPLVRELAVVALGDLPSPEASRSLRLALRSRYPEVRFQAALSYVQVCEQPELPALAPLLRDADAKVRANTARALANVGAAAAPELRRAQGDADGAVRAEAALALLRLGETPDPDALRGAFDDPELLSEAIDAVAALQLRPLRDEVARVAQSVLKPLPLKAAAARALLRLGDTRGIPALRSVLRAFRNDGRSHAVEVVGELGVRELTPELVRLSRWLRGTDPEALVAALAALLPLDARAREGLDRLARRDDAAGAQARAALVRAR